MRMPSKQNSQLSRPFLSLFSDYPEGGRSFLLLNDRIYFQITSFNISEDWNLHKNRCKNANSRKMKFFVRVTMQHNSSCVNVKTTLGLKTKLAMQRGISV